MRLLSMAKRKPANGAALARKPEKNR